MELSTEQKRVVEQTVNVWETGKVTGDYGQISRYNDGPDDRRQITYGRSQTTEYSHLRELVQQYVDARGVFSEALAPYVGYIGKRALVNDHKFTQLLEDAGDDPVMRSVQDEVFEEKYFEPALHWAEVMGFTTALGMLVIYDSFIHSGGILTFLRNRFPARVPVRGGDEKEWCRQYVATRDEWLKHHPRKILRQTLYRTACLREQMEAGNWDLAHDIHTQGEIVKGAG